MQLAGFGLLPSVCALPPPPSPYTHSNLRHLPDYLYGSHFRSLGGIGALVEHGINNDIPEVHRAACGALRNLSYGRANDENKVRSCYFCYCKRNC